MKLSRLLGRSRPGGQVETLLGSPLNDPQRVQSAFGSRQPSASLVQQKYFALSADQRPSLSPWFDAGYYREANPDVAEAGLDPYLHFLAYGLEEGRHPHPLVDLEYVRVQVQQGGDAAWNLARLADYLRRNPHLLDPAEAELRRARPELTGSFDGFQDGLAVGWAYDPQDPAARLVVEIVELVDGVAELRARGRADVPRADLRENGIGDGRYHFALKLSDVIADGATHRLQARVGSGWLAGEHDYRAEVVQRREFDPLPDAPTRALATEASAAWSDRREADGFVRRMLQLNLMLATREIASAAEELQVIDAAHPGIELVQLKLAEAKMRLGQTEAAAAMYQSLTGSPRLAGWAWLGLANARHALGQWQEAEEAYLRGHAIAPDLPRLASRVRAAGYRAARARARELASAGDTQRALDLLTPELIAHPDDQEVCDLVIGVLDLQAALQGKAQTPVSPYKARAERSRRLLELALAQAEQRMGAAR